MKKSNRSYFVYFSGGMMLILGGLLAGSACSSKKNNSDETSTGNVSTIVVSNLSAISADFTPASLSSTTTSFSMKNVNDVIFRPQADVCESESNFAVCQSNLIREYLKIGKSMVDLLGTLAGGIGGALGQLADGASGDSEDGKISFNKTDSDTWAILARGTGNASVAHFAVDGGTYTLQLDNAAAEEEPSSIQTEAVVNFTDADNWTVDVFFSKTECDITDVGAPSKAQIRVGRANGLWTGKAMLYAPRWNEPGQSVSCATAAGLYEIAMYTDFVGNDDSTKAALYMIPATTSSLASIGDFDLEDFCTNFSSACGGADQPTSGFLADYPNNWCTTGPGTSPTWGDDCSTNTAVAGAAYSAASEWIVPSVLKDKEITLPTSLSN